MEYKEKVDSVRFFIKEKRKRRETNPLSCRIIISTERGWITMSRGAVSLLKITCPGCYLLGTDNWGRIIIKECSEEDTNFYRFNKKRILRCSDFIRYIKAQHLLNAATKSYSSNGVSLFYNIYRDDKTGFLIITTNRPFDGNFQG